MEASPEAPVYRVLWGIETTVRNEIIAAEKTGSLSPEGRREKLAPVFEQAYQKIEAARAEAAELEKNADEMDAEAMDLAQSVSDSEADDAFVRNQLAEAVRVGGDAARKNLADRFFKACNTPRDRWKRADAALVRAVLDSADLGAPVLEPFVVNAGYQALEAQAPKSVHAQARRERAANIRGMASAVEATLDKEAAGSC